MIRLAIKMIMGDRLKYLGLLIGLAFAATLITQQASIFMGYTRRTWAFIDDTPHADIWVMDEQVRFTEDSKPLQDVVLYRTRGVPGVDWAMPMYRAQLPVRLADGSLEMTNIIGVDDATLLGGPVRMLDGSLEDLRQADSVIVERRAAEGDLKITQADGTTRPLRVGDTLSINDNAARVVGICDTRDPFYWQPSLYTTYSRALQFAPQQRKLMSYVLVGAKPGEDVNALATRISDFTGEKARTAKDFASLTMWYTLINTGILVNFGITVALGFVIGLLVCGQTFFNYVVDNARYFGALKALGVTNVKLLAMIFTQVLVVGGLGFGLGAGCAAITGILLKPVGVGFFMPWQLLVGSGVGMLLICLASAGISAINILRLEPGIVFKS
ncbi:MAG TPA: ABC transporter permease [Phycisphaerales bacterium]|nr:ABC transporter permease [Phycisphaerales bacterium]